jgi:Zn finger protein HypA/HybF involved in hydrogenase expression
LCDHCGDWHTELLQGDEMLLTSLELELEENDV